MSDWGSAPQRNPGRIGLTHYDQITIFHEPRSRSAMIETPRKAFLCNGDHTLTPKETRCPASAPIRSCSLTRPRRRCSIRDAVVPRPGRSGPMPATTGHGAVAIHQRSPMSTRPTARPSARPYAWQGSRACCRSTAMPATARSPGAATSPWRSTGPMFAGGSTSLRRRAPHR